MEIHYSFAAPRNMHRSFFRACGGHASVLCAWMNQRTTIMGRGRMIYARWGGEGRTVCLTMPLPHTGKKADHPLFPISPSSRSWISAIYELVVATFGAHLSIQEKRFSRAKAKRRRMWWREGLRREVRSITFFSSKGGWFESITPSSSGGEFGSITSSSSIDQFFSSFRPSKFP